MIRAFVPFINKTEKVIVVGNSSRLGNWDPSSGFIMKKNSPFIFTAHINIADEEEWKLVILDSSNKITWEEGENRYGSTKETIWFRGGRKATGLAVPLFSLRSNYDNGIGDFSSLELFIRKIKADGEKIIRLLPINDTNDDPNPFNIISSFAINPLYISLDKMGCLEDIEVSHSIADKSNQINYSPFVEWEDVIQIKWDYFRAIYNQDGEKTISSKEFKKFMEQEKFWIVPYALFRYLSKTNEKTCNKPYSDDLVQSIIKDPEKKAEIYFYIYIQFHAYKQLRSVRELAQKLDILLQCEFPMSVSKNSADSWQFPNLLKDGVSAGVEPDAKCITGEKSDMGTLNLSKEGNAWLIRRLQNLDRFYDICKIDNIFSYFRTWEIQDSRITAIQGYYNPSIPYTRKELDKLGFSLDEFRDTHPYLTREYILNIFGKDFKRFGEFFKKRAEDGLYYFKKDMSSPLNILNYFKDRKEEEFPLRDGLIRLQEECLFIKFEDKFIPRIAAQYTNGYAILSKSQKDIFNKLYDDYYYSRSNKLWERTGYKKLLTLTSNSRMLFCTDCSEMLPDFVKNAISRFGILPVEMIEDNRNQYMSIAKIKNLMDTQPVTEWLKHNCQNMSSSSAITIIPIQYWLAKDNNYPKDTDYNEKDISGAIRENWNWRVNPAYLLKGEPTI